MQARQVSESSLRAWRERFKALYNIPPALNIVWEAGPGVTASGIGCRFVASLVPIALLAVSRRIIDGIVAVVRSQSQVSLGFWWLVALEFGLAPSGTIMARLCDYCDGLLADRFTRHLSIRIMEHAFRRVTLPVQSGPRLRAVIQIECGSKPFAGVRHGGTSGIVVRIDWATGALGPKENSPPSLQHVMFQHRGFGKALKHQDVKADGNERSRSQGCKRFPSAGDIFSVKLRCRGIVFRCPRSL